MAEAFTLAMCGLKGGAGKTTLCVQLATILARRGHTVLILDADSVTYAASEWGAIRHGKARGRLFSGGPPLGAATRVDVLTAGTEIGADLQWAVRRGPLHNYDAILIDCPPNDGEITRSAMLEADFCVLPSSSGFTDVVALRRTVELWREARKISRGLKACCVLSNVRAGLEETDLALEATRAHKLPTFTLHQATAFKISMGEGKGACEMYRPSHRSVANAVRLTDDVMKAAR